MSSVTTSYLLVPSNDIQNGSLSRAYSASRSQTRDIPVTSQGKSRDQITSRGILSDSRKSPSSANMTSRPRAMSHVPKTLLDIPMTSLERRLTLLPSGQRPGSRQSLVRQGSAASRRSTKHDILSANKDGVNLENRRESGASSSSWESKSKSSSQRGRSRRSKQSSYITDEEDEETRARRLLTKWRLAGKMIIAAGHLINKHIKTCDYVGSPYLKQLESIDSIASLGINRDHYLFFDPSDFKANKQMKMTYEAKRILTKRPLYRSEQEIYYAMIALRSVPSVADYPVRMQRKLAQWGSFEAFEPKRIIVRQGDPPFAFYFIVYGSVLVCILNEDKSEARTVCYLHRSDSFGELAIVNRSNRQSTVISKTYVEMLTISEEAYEQIFMVGGSRTINDPDHEQFMKSLTFLNGWPRQLLVNDPKKFMFTYFQRNAVLARNTKYSKWIFIVKSGSIRVLMKLLRNEPDKTAKLGFIQRPFSETSYIYASNPMTGCSAHDIISVLAQYNKPLSRPLTSHERVRCVLTAQQMRENRMRPRTHVVTSRTKLDADKPTPIGMDKEQSQAEKPLSKPTNDDAPNVVTSQTNVIATNEKADVMTSRRDDGDPGERRTIYDDLDADFNEQKVELTAADLDPQFVHVRTLTKGMIFGLETEMFDDQPAMSLVSNGAECILLSKKFYMDNCPPALINRLRIEVSPYPPEQQLQDNLLTRLNWDAYKENNLLNALIHRRTVHNKLKPQI